MLIFDKLLFQLQSVFTKGAFGLSIFELTLVILSFILALLIRGLFAKFIIKKIKIIVLKTTNVRAPNDNKETAKGGFKR